MKRLLVVPILVLVIAMTGIAWGATTNQAHNRPVPVTCTVQGLRPFSARVWSPDRWNRSKTGMPSGAVTRAYRRRLSCAPPHHRVAMKKNWKKDKEAFFEYRKGKLWVAKYKPYVYPDGSHWAAPYPVVWCESGPGGNYYISSAGAYGLTSGGGFPQNMTPREQDEAAYHALHTEGEYQVWARWEIEQGCPYR